MRKACLITRTFECEKKVSATECRRYSLLRNTHHGGGKDCRAALTGSDACPQQTSAVVLPNPRFASSRYLHRRGLVRPTSQVLNKFMLKVF